MDGMRVAELTPTMADYRGRAAFDQLKKLEQEASRIFLNQPLFVPGLLQVPGYAAEIISRVGGVPAGSQALTDRVDERMRRAEMFEQRLRGANPPQLLVVLDEAVLRRAAGGLDPAVAHEQFDRLLAVARLETVRLAILAYTDGLHPGLGGSFEVHETADGRASVFFEADHGDELVGTESAVAEHYRDLAMSMAEAAVTGAGAQALLESISKSL